MPTGGTPILTLSDGTEITFGRKRNTDSYYYATRIEKNTNRIDVQYVKKGTTGGAIDWVRYSNDGAAKYVDFHYIAGSNHLDAITWGPDDNEISFTYANGDKTLASVTMPEGERWRYYHSRKNIALRNTWFLDDVYTPSGGQYSYSYKTYTKPCGGIARKIHGGISTKVVHDSIKSGTWIYDYGADNVTTVTEPNNRTTTYEFYGVGNTGGGSCYKYGLMQSKEVTDNGLSETTSYTWDKLDNPISYASYGVGCVCSDGNTYVPVLASETTNIEGTVYTTDYEEYDDYANPTRVVETGTNTRTTTTDYWYNTSWNMVKGYPEVVTVSGDSTFSGTFVSGYSYYDDPAEKVGRILQLNDYGIKTTYYYDGNGNLYRVRDGNLKNTYYTWSNGSQRGVKSAFGCLVLLFILVTVIGEV